MTTPGNVLSKSISCVLCGRNTHRRIVGKPNATQPCRAEFLLFEDHIVHVGSSPAVCIPFFCFLLLFFVCFFFLVQFLLLRASIFCCTVHRRHCHVSIISCPVATATYYFSSPHWLLLTAYCSCISIYPIIPCTCTGGQNDPCETSQESYPSGDADGRPPFALL